MTRLSKLTSVLFRFLVVWTVDTLSLLIAAFILPSVVLTPGATGSTVAAAASAALMLGLVNFAIRPIVLLVAQPFGFIVMFVVGFFVNALALIITSALLPQFEVNGLLGAIVAGIVLAALNTFLGGMFSVDDSDSFYENRIARAARKHPFRGAAEPGRGLVMLEVDGLSYWHLRAALAQGAMPTVQEMIEKDGYVLSRVDCGLPSQTSACQAGIMFGDNYDIPSFRWYDKEKKKLYVSGHDADEINARYADGEGLLRGGSSINNMMAGDAEKSSLTLANILSGTPEEKKRRAEDIYLLMLDPYFFMRTIARFLGEAALEVWQYFKQKQADVQPRLNRLHGGYPFVRAATTVLMRDLASSLVKLDIMRGSPSIYTTLVGYDEVAHHSGPWTSDAFSVLKRFDRVIAQTRDVISRRAPRPYELLLLSDHGQSFGATFKQRYGMDLKVFIESKLPQGASVAQSLGGDDGGPGLGAIGAELQNAQEQGVGGAAGQFVVKQTQKLTRRGSRAAQDAQDAQNAGQADVMVCGSGNIAQVYFDLQPRRVTLRELALAYPGMVDALVQHEGVGFVVGYDDDCVPIVLGKGGSRNLHTGVVTGDDPLKPFADGSVPPGGAVSDGLGPVGQGSLDDRIWQVRRVADFPHAGDLIVNSPVYPDGTVAAMEELIGSHGGMGGEQTDAFLLHPGDLALPPTRNSVDLYAVLDGRRGLPPVVNAQVGRAAEVEPWSLSTLGRGLADVGSWLGRAGRAIFLDRTAYREIVNDPYSTGPALLIGIASQILASVVREGRFDPLNALLTVTAWLAAAVALWFAGRLLGGKGTFTATLRGFGFAHSAYVIVLLGAVFPALRPLTSLIAVLLSILGIWIGAAEAHKTRGWRTVVFPVVAVAIAILGLALVQQLVAGAALTLQSIAQTLGLAPN
jgi:uncharacterized membrane protein YvlD (DUF360 family)